MGKPAIDELQTVRHERFGLTDFRPGQERSIRFLLDGRDVLP